MSNLETCSLAVIPYLKYFLNEDGTVKQPLDIIAVREAIWNDIPETARTSTHRTEFETLFEPVGREIVKMAAFENKVGGGHNRAFYEKRQKESVGRGFGRVAYEQGDGGALCMVLGALVTAISLWATYSLYKGGYRKNKKIRSTKKKQSQKQRRRNQSRRQ